MTKYIDADALEYTPDSFKTNYEVKLYIDKQPAADVEEVVHGEWETDRDTIRCSVCGFGYFPHGYFFKDGQCVGDLIFVRCPECGAKMDGEKGGRMKSILKPCPFCGSLEIAIGSDEGTVTRHNTAFGDLTRTVPSARWAYCCTCGCSAPSVKVKNYKGWYDEKEQADALERAIAAWNRRTEQERQWISVKDRLPDMCGCKCLVVGTNRFGQVDVFTAFTGYMERGKLEFHSCEPTHEIPAWTVTHWMPLPKPPAHCGRLLTEGSAE